MSDEKPKLTPEQIAEFKEKMTKGYKDEIEFLKVQVEYEELSARIMEAKARVARAESILAQIYAPSPEEKEEKKEEAGAKTENTASAGNGERKLKVTATQ